MADVNPIKPVIELNVNGLTFQLNGRNWKNGGKEYNPSKCYL